jgi:glycosyltransferase involved in cell wall biosynthesis
MKQLVFLTSEDLLDVDLPVVKEINSRYHSLYHITWVIILKGYGWYKKNDIEIFCLENEIDYVLFEQKRKLKNPLNILFHLNILHLIKTLKPHIVYDSYLGVPYMHFFSGLFLDKRKMVIAIHDVEQHYKMKNKFIRAQYYSFLMRKYLNFHIFSQHQLKIFDRLYIGKNAFVSPLYLKNFGSPPAKNRLEKKKTQFLFFGIIRPNKGLDLLFSAARIIGKKRSDFHITIAGKCDNWAPYQQMIENDTHFTCIIRNIDQGEIPSLFFDTHFTVLPYRDVTQSGVLLTAYNYKVPAIASDLEGFAEYIQDGQTGYLFESGNIKALANQLEKAMDLDGNDYQKMITKLDTYISTDISIEGISAKYINFFDQL